MRDDPREERGRGGRGQPRRAGAGVAQHRLRDPEGIAGSPATFSADLINQIDVGQILAGVAGS
ncbi:hypothetical protein [Dietzia kunjamensis]|uniref:hypothetical protein n=1 Tax=Dietzia kunjamensis TaxID=322509 RepID=UPI0039BCE98F